MLYLGDYSKSRGYEAFLNFRFLQKKADSCRKKQTGLEEVVKATSAACCSRSHDAHHI